MIKKYFRVTSNKYGPVPTLRRPRSHNLSSMTATKQTRLSKLCRSHKLTPKFHTTPICCCTSNLVGLELFYGLPRVKHSAGLKLYGDLRISSNSMLFFLFQTFVKVEGRFDTKGRLSLVC